MMPSIHAGSPRKPAVILIHGLGMDEGIWQKPDDARILGGTFPVSLLLSHRPPDPRSPGSSGGRSSALPGGMIAGSRPVHLRTICHDLRDLGYSVITWTQRRPAGPLDAAVSELSEVIEAVGNLSKRGIILVGHSRGGLIARRHLTAGDRRIRGLVTICSPHHGSSIARIASSVRPVIRILSPFLPADTNSAFLKKAVKRIADFLTSSALQELLPDAPLFTAFPNLRGKNIATVSIGGTSPTFFSLYRWKGDGRTTEEVPSRGTDPELLFSVPDILETVIPRDIYPPELRKGLGDGLVTAESARLNWGGAHHDLRLNHAEILFDRAARDLICREIVRMTMHAPDS